MIRVVAPSVFCRGEISLYKNSMSRKRTIVVNKRRAPNIVGCPSNKCYPYAIQMLNNTVWNILVSDVHEQHLDDGFLGAPGDAENGITADQMEAATNYMVSIVSKK